MITFYIGARGCVFGFVLPRVASVHCKQYGIRKSMYDLLTNTYFKEVMFVSMYVGGYLRPCRLCPHVVIVVGLVCVNNPWGYAVEPLMPDRSKVRVQTKLVYAGLRGARTVEVRFQDASAHQT